MYVFMSIMGRLIERRLDYYEQKHYCIPPPTHTHTRARTKQIIFTLKILLKKTHFIISKFYYWLLLLFAIRFKSMLLKGSMQYKVNKYYFNIFWR